MEDETKKKIAVIVLCCLVFLGLGFYYAREKDKDERAKVVTPEQIQNTDEFARQLHIQKSDALELTDRINKASTGTPNVSYYITAPTIERAAEQTAEAINRKDESLPAIATAKSDRTVVTPDKDRQKVDVYKINLNKAHKIKAGILQTTEHTYYGVGYQAGKWEGMVYTRTGKKIEAGTVTYTVKEW